MYKYFENCQMIIKNICLFMEVGHLKCVSNANQMDKDKGQRSLKNEF